MSVHLCSFISLSVRLSVRLCSSVICLSVSLSVRLSFVRISVHPFLCPSVSVHISVRPSVTCPSLCSPCSSRSLSRALVDPVVHCNLSYKVLSLYPAQPAPVSGGQLLLCALFVIISGCLCIGGPTTRLVKQLGAVDINKESLFLIVWSRVAVLRPAARPTATCQFNYNWQVSTD